MPHGKFTFETATTKCTLKFVAKLSCPATFLPKHSQYFLLDVFIFCFCFCFSFFVVFFALPFASFRFFSYAYALIVDCGLLLLLSLSIHFCQSFANFKLVVCGHTLTLKHQHQHEISIDIKMLNIWIDTSYPVSIVSYRIARYIVCTDSVNNLALDWPLFV